MNELISKCQIALAKKHNVDINDLHYLGYSDCSMIRGEGAVSINFNLIKEGHVHHKSTVAINSWNV
jgi:hypothetical protein